MKDFNIAKYLKENHLGSHGILGRYVDLHALKEDEQKPREFKDDASGLMVYWGKKPSGDKAILVKKHGEDLSPDDQENLSDKELNILSTLKQQAMEYSRMPTIKEEDDYGNNEPTQEVPYVGADEKLDGFGDEFDQVDPVSEVEDEDYSEEQGQFDTMMDLSHEYLGDPRVSKIIRTSIKNLRDHGFSDQDIVDFLATEF